MYWNRKLKRYDWNTFLKQQTYSCSLQATGRKGERRQYRYYQVFNHLNLQDRVLSAFQSENWKMVSGLLLSVGFVGCSVFVGVVLPWEWEEEECELSLELLRVSVLVLVFFIFRLFARGALSTFWRQNPSLLYLLKACFKIKGNSKLFKRFKTFYSLYLMNVQWKDKLSSLDH